MKPRKRRKLNPARVKIHRSYTVHEAARLLEVQRGTVRRWLKAGLACCDNQRPYLIRGRDLRHFLQQRRAKRRHPCEPGQIYCVACHEPVLPALNMADCVLLTDTTGDLRGLCPRCERVIHRRVNIAKLPQVRGNLDVALAKADSRLSETVVLSLDARLQPCNVARPTNTTDRGNPLAQYRQS